MPRFRQTQIGTDGVDRLVAYVVFDGPAALAQLAEELPDYLTPAAVVRVEPLPITEYGAVDRQELAKRPLPGR